MASLRTTVQLALLVTTFFSPLACQSAQDTAKQWSDQAARVLKEFGARVIVRDELVRQQVKMIGATSIILQSVKTSQNSQDDASVGSYGLERSDFTLIVASIPVIRRAVPMREVPAEARRDESVSQIRLVGCTPDYFRLSQLPVERGRGLTDADLMTKRNVAVLSHAVSRELFSGRNPVGQTIEIAGVSFSVVGMRPQREDTDIAVRHSLGRSDDARDVYIPLTTMRVPFDSQPTSRQDERGSHEFAELSQITVVVEDVSQVEPTAKIIDTLLKKRHKRPDYSILVPLDLSRRASESSNLERNQVVGVNLSSVRITDTALKLVALLPSLEMLLLNGTDVTDQGLKHLHGLKSLKTLFLRQTKVTDAGVADLQEALPDCTIYH